VASVAFTVADSVADIYKLLDYQVFRQEESALCSNSLRATRNR